MFDIIAFVCMWITKSKIILSKIETSQLHSKNHHNRVVFFFSRWASKLKLFIVWEYFTFIHLQFCINIIKDDFLSNNFVGVRKPTGSLLNRKCEVSSKSSIETSAWLCLFSSVKWIQKEKNISNISVNNFWNFLLLFAMAYCLGTFDFEN